MPDQKIFISYRRSDASGYAGRLFDRLSARFGDENIFMDVDDLDPGVDFVIALEKAVNASDVLIVLMGARWLEVEDEDGQRRLDDPEDFVRIEVAAALDHKVRVIPVLVQDARMPGSRDLPSALNKLSRLNAVKIRHERFNADVDRLIRSINDYFKEITERREREAAERAAREQIERDRRARELARQQDRINSYLNQGSTALEKKDWETAQRNYREILRLQPNHDDAQQGLQIASGNLELNRLYGQAILLQDEGQFDRALQNLRRIQQKNEDFRDVSERIIEIEALQQEEIHQRQISETESYLADNSTFITRLRDLPRGMWYLGSGAILVFFLGLSFLGGKGLIVSEGEDRPSLISDDFGVPMAFVPAGPFEMGSDDGDASEKPAHTVNLDDYYIDQYEVTNARYAECVEVGVCPPPINDDSFSRENYYGNATYANYPLIWVNWHAAQTYCRWRGARLPTEAEWEKAARGVDARIYPWGDEFNGTLVNFCDTNCEFDLKTNQLNDGYSDTAPVGSYHGGASPYNIFDMAGNVWEWVADWFDGAYYADSPENNPTGPDDGSHRVIRGGSWDNEPNGVRSALRNELEPDFASNNIGFRCARDASP